MINTPRNPNHAWVQNNGGFASPTTNMLCLPDGRTVNFPLNTPDPLAWARDWLTTNAPDVPLHPEFVTTL